MGVCSLKTVFVVSLLASGPVVRGDEPAPPPPNNVAPFEPRRGGFVKREIVTLARPGVSRQTFLAPDLSAYRRLAAAQDAGHDGEVRKLIELRKVVKLANGTRAAVEKVRPDMLSVRVLDGPEADLVAWVRTEHVVATGVSLPEAPPEPKYRFVPAGDVEPGTTLYAFREGGDHVPVATDFFAHVDLEKSLLAADQKGVDELRAAGRLFTVPNGTAVKALEYHTALLTKLSCYEVRVLDGTHADQKGWVVAAWARQRVAAPAPAAPQARTKPRPKPGRR